MKKILDFFKKLVGRKLAMYIGLAIISILFLGALFSFVFANFTAFFTGGQIRFTLSMVFSLKSLGVGLISTIVLGVVTGVFAGGLLSGNNGSGLLQGSKDADVFSALENSRFLTEKERDKYFDLHTYEELDALKKPKQDGVPVRAYVDKKGKLQVNFLNGAHSLVIGATGSGKTTTFINPMIQLLGACGSGSSMIMTDPKGELFDLHSKFLKSRGYDVMVLDLRDTYSSSRWNPLEGIWDAYQEYVRADQGMILHRDSMADYPDLTRVDGEAEEDEPWIEWNGKAYADAYQCQSEVSVAKQKIFDEMYEDLNDLVAGICPITNEKDPLWEKGARSIVMATCLAMLEDSENPELGMTKEKFNFFNLNKILTNSDNEYAVLKDYFKGRSPLSQAVTMSRQVLAAADQTMSSYMSITFDKLSLFNDRGLCGLTSATDIHAEQFAERPSALFLKIPDEKDTRHGLASLFILSMYKALIKVASGNEDLSLPRNVYFIMDEFGNMPKIEKFGQMITVGRSRKIWFNMVVQSYSQLNNVYGETTADIVKSNCGMKMFIGSNDIGTCKEFSELCGNKTVKTTSTSSSTGAKEGDMSVSTQTQTRPLIYPSELQKLNNKESTGNAIIVTFGNFPLMTKYTPSYKCDFYQFGRMDMAEIRSNVFRAEDAFYDIAKRNELMGVVSEEE